MAASTRSLIREPGYTSGTYVLFGASATILGALAFEHIGGYAPCPLCLMQRWAYYAGIPLAFGGLVAMSAGARTLSGILFLVAGLGFFANAILGGYHAGVEWGFWPGPDTCANAAQPLSGGTALLESLKQAAVVSCKDPAIRIFGLSFAGWNVIISGALAACGLFAANANLDMARQHEL